MAEESEESLLDQYGRKKFNLFGEFGQFIKSELAGERHC